MSESLHQQSEIIESGYEYLLAYAAQGRDTDQGPGGTELRATLENMAAASDAIRNELYDNPDEFSQVIVDDARKARAAIGLVLAQSAISSELVDNLNASIHLRALLTDLFLLTEAVR